MSDPCDNYDGAFDPPVKRRPKPAPLHDLIDWEQAHEKARGRRYRIREVAALLDVKPHVVRFWEELCGITPLRSKSGQRVYTDKHVERLTQVKHLRAGGLSLKAIRGFLRGGACPVCGRRKS